MTQHSFSFSFIPQNLSKSHVLDTLSTLWAYKGSEYTTYVLREMHSCVDINSSALGDSTFLHALFSDLCSWMIFYFAPSSQTFQGSSAILTGR